MKRFFLLILLACAAAGIAGVARAQTGERVFRDLAYRTDDGDAAVGSHCRIDLSCPPGEGFATLVWFHGGGLTSGRRELPEALCGKGFAVAGAGYRLAPEAAVETCIEDAAAAVAWVVEHIAEYGGDPHRIFVGGHSAGGYLTSMLMLDKRWLAPYKIDPDTTFVAAIPYSGQAVTHFTRRREMGIPDTQPIVDDLAPLYHVRPDCVPLLLLSGDRELEMLGRYEENAYFRRMMRVAGHPDVELLEFDGFDHVSMLAPGHLVAVKYMLERLRAVER